MEDQPHHQQVGQQRDQLDDGFAAFFVGAEDVRGLSQRQPEGDQGDEGVQPAQQGAGEGRLDLEQRMPWAAGSISSE